MIIPTYKQSDPAWGGDQMGDSGLSLSQAGCLVTSSAMMIQGFRNNENGAYINPHDLNAWLSANGGYVPGSGNLYWGALTKVPGSDCQYQEYVPGKANGVVADLALVSDRARKGWLGLCEVRWGGDPNKNHFVLLAGPSGDWDYDVFDPAIGDMTHFASGRFGSGSAAEDIWGVHYFADATPDTPPVVPAPVTPPANPIPAPIPEQLPNPVEAPVVPVETPSTPVDTSVPTDLPTTPLPVTDLPKEGVSLMSQVQVVLGFLAGKKTYIGIVAGAVYSILVYFSVVPDNSLVWTAIAAWTGVSARLAISKGVSQ